MLQPNIFVAGIDVSKERLDVAIDGTGEMLQVANDAQGHRKLVNWLAEHGVRRVGLEASGGYERGSAEALRKAGFEVAILQPRQVRAFAVYKLKRAKNDRIDAGLIARCTAELDVVRPTRDPRLAAMDEHLRLIEQIEADCSRMKTRREAYRTPRLDRWIGQEIARLERRLKAELTLMVKAIFQHEDLVRRLRLIESVEGVGQRTAITLLILMPELGQLSREQIASLAGLAPFDDDTGKQRGHRHIAGGRFRVRRAIYAAALAASFHWNPSLVAFYARLRAKGRPHKPALIACARKLLIFVNTVVARGVAWEKRTCVSNGC
jgi:transposase